MHSSASTRPPCAWPKPKKKAHPRCSPPTSLTFAFAGRRTPRNSYRLGGRDSTVCCARELKCTSSASTRTPAKPLPIPALCSPKVRGLKPQDLTPDADKQPLYLHLLS